MLPSSRLSPVRPVRPRGMRAFSSSEDGKRGRFFDFLKGAASADEKAKEIEEEKKEEATPEPETQQ